MDYKDFFLTNNGSGWKTTENKLSNSRPDIFKLVMDYSNLNDLNDLSFKEKVWHFINNSISVPTCNECGKLLKFKNSLNQGYGKYCSLSCTNKNKDHINSVKETIIEKYNGPSPFSSEEINNKRKKTMVDKYGVDNIFKDVEYIKEKTFKKHGVTHISKLEKTKLNRVKTNIDKYGVSTPLLLDENRLKNVESKLNNFNIKYSDLNITKNTGNDINIICDECNSEYSIERALLLYRYENNVNPCVLCNPINELKSIKEKELSDYIKSLNIEIIEGDRNILNNLELDIYIPSKNIAIEFDGLYWHNELFKDKNYHLNKTELCEEKGIKLIHVFEDEWTFKQEIVKSRIKNILGFSERKIYARKCEIKEVKTKDKTKFLNENHIQGTVGSNINLGLYHNGELVSLMTFGDLRINMGQKSKDNIYELLRFCNKLNTNVVGGASKLYEHFIKIHKPNELISYADRRWSQGELYKKLGFELTHKTQPNYWYVIDNNRKHRFGFRKDMLIKEGFNKELSEHEIMLKRKIYRIYDCGNFAFKLIYN
jgi:hypothetical protein